MIQNFVKNNGNLLHTVRRRLADPSSVSDEVPMFDNCRELFRKVFRNMVFQQVMYISQAMNIIPSPDKRGSDFAEGFGFRISFFYDTSDLTGRVINLIKDNLLETGHHIKEKQCIRLKMQGIEISCYFLSSLPGLFAG